MAGPLDRNPFVGPRPIRRGEPLYGRSAELSEVCDRLKARRVLVLHSPSGAGKTSLVLAGVVPRMKRAHFDVWKPMRVGLDPATFDGVPEGTNRYVLSALVSLEDELPDARRRSPAELAKLDFLEYLDTRPRRRKRVDQSVVLIFDQFEEILTTAPQATDAKREFFAAVGRALGEEKYWALFIVREDLLAALTPYRDLIPTGMTNTVRLDLLSPENARLAAVKLAEDGGRSFQAADALIHDLSIIEVRQPDGSFSAEPGEWVEPVHLQIVCRQLWDEMARDKLSIGAEEIETHAGVSATLGAYYADAVRACAADDIDVERSIRAWFGQVLMVGGRRSQLRWGADINLGLADHLIEQLLAAHLVRTERRVDASWLELSHDRLLQPIEKNNAAWAQAHPDRGAPSRLRGAPHDFSLNEESWVSSPGYGSTGGDAGAGPGVGALPMKGAHGGEAPWTESALSSGGSWVTTPALAGPRGLEQGARAVSQARVRGASATDVALRTYLAKKILEVANAKGDKALIGVALAALGMTSAKWSFLTMMNQNVLLDDDRLIEQLHGLLTELVDKHAYASIPSEDHPTLADLVTGLVDLGDAVRRARGSRKRKILTAAFWAGFRPEYFVTGMAKHLWSIACSIEYLEFRYLDILLGSHEVGARFGVRAHDLGFFQVLKLRELGLVTCEDGSLVGAAEATQHERAVVLSAVALMFQEFLLAGDPGLDDDNAITGP